jgi:hypothetical protein
METLPYRQVLELGGGITHVAVKVMVDYIPTPNPSRYCCVTQASMMDRAIYNQGMMPAHGP